jgi:hypothetical protein
MRTKKFLLAMILFLLPSTVYAQNQNERIQTLYVKSGMDKQVKQLPLLIQTGVDRALEEDGRIKQMPRNVKLAISSSVHQAFAIDRFKKTIIEEIKETMTNKDLDKVMAWLESSLGKKCTQLEEAASTPEAFSEIQKLATQVQKSPPAEDRVDILKKLDAAVKATETNVEIAMNTQLAVAVAIVASLPLEQQAPIDVIVAGLEKTRPQIEAIMRSQTLLFALYTYQDLTNTELEKYIAFATSPAGTKYHTSTISGFKKALLDGSFKWGESIADILERFKNQSET